MWISGLYLELAVDGEEMVDDFEALGVVVVSVLANDEKLEDVEERITAVLLDRTAMELLCELAAVNFGANVVALRLVLDERVNEAGRPD